MKLKFKAEMIEDDAVTLAKMAGLASKNFIIGNASGNPSAVTMSGDATLSNTGVTYYKQWRYAVEASMLSDSPTVIYFKYRFKDKLAPQEQCRRLRCNIGNYAA